ncbi:rod shape-determining protein RodA [Candidatus Parcubacteria bacterium]|nr:rod shape-determining protein RodA [Candidatus Parcubacteria bacterium]
MKKFLKTFDFSTFVPIILISSLGLSVLYSTNQEAFQWQVKFFAVGFLVYAALALLNYSFWRKYWWLFYLASLVLLGVVYFSGAATRGSVRWLSLGPLNLQPSEFSKTALILGLAALLQSSRTKYLTWQKVLWSAVLVLPVLGLVYLQPDLGTTIVLVAIWLGMLLFAGLRPRWLFLSLCLLGIFSYPLWGFLADYQKQRVVFFLNPRADPLGGGYHVLQSMIAVSSGQWLGRGFGRGTQSHLRFLPEHYTDFVFAAFCEEWGFVGGIVLIGLLFFLIWRILEVAKRARSDFGTLVCIGVVSMLAVQVFVNIGMNMGMMPITGITLPLVSYGGSSLWTTIIALGLVQSISSRARNASKTN